MQSLSPPGIQCSRLYCPYPSFGLEGWRLDPPPLFHWLSVIMITDPKYTKTIWLSQHQHTPVDWLLHRLTPNSLHSLFRLLLQSCLPSAVSWPLMGQRSPVSWAQSAFSSVWTVWRGFYRWSRLRWPAENDSWGACSRRVRRNRWMNMNNLSASFYISQLLDNMSVCYLFLFDLLKHNSSRQQKTLHAPVNRTSVVCLTDRYNLTSCMRPSPLTTKSLMNSAGLEQDDCRYISHSRIYALIWCHLWPAADVSLFFGVQPLVCFNICMCVCSPGCGSDAGVLAAAGGAGEPAAGAPAQPAVLPHPPGHTAPGIHGSDTGHITAWIRQH